MNWFKKLLKQHKNQKHVCKYYPVAIKSGLEVHNFCNCGRSYKLKDYYH